MLLKCKSYTTNDLNPPPQKKFLAKVYSFLSELIALKMSILRIFVQRAPTKAKSSDQLRKGQDPWETLHGRSLDEVKGLGVIGLPTTELQLPSAPSLSIFVQNSPWTDNKAHS